MKKKVRQIISEILGWYGVIAIIIAYALVSFSIVGVHSLVYQILNATGSIGIIIHSLTKKDYQPVILNLIWVLIAIIALAQLFF